MPFRITCPCCKASYLIDDALRGQHIQCKECHKRLAIPAAKNPPLPAPPPRDPANAVKAHKTNPLPTREEVPKAAALPDPRRDIPDERRPLRRKHTKSGGFPLLLVMAAAVGVVGLFMVCGAIGVVYFAFTSSSSGSVKSAAAKQAPAPKPHQRALEPQEIKEPEAKAKLDPDFGNNNGPRDPKPPPPKRDTNKPVMPAGWKTFVHREGKFSIGMPFDSIEFSATFKAAEGIAGSIRGFKFENEPTRTEFTAYCLVIPKIPAAHEYDEFFGDLVESFARRGEIRVVSKVVITHENHPGREVVLSKQMQNFADAAFIRVFLVNDHVYLLFATALGIDPDSPDYQTFFGSFRLVED